MLRLLESLQGRDLGHLRIVAEFWGIDLKAPDTHLGLQRLVPLLLDRSRLTVVINELAPESQAALEDLLKNEGRLSWASFTRQHGLLREMGPGKRDRERPYINDPSPTESLYYRALIGRGFYELSSGPQEFAYVPEEFLSFLPQPKAVKGPLLCRPASPAERATLDPADDRILDMACTLLAALRLGMENDKLRLLWTDPPDPITLKLLLKTSGLLSTDDEPLLEPIRIFLESSRAEALAFLTRSWLSSLDFNELRLLTGLQAEGEWTNDPFQTRQIITGFLPPLPNGAGNKDQKASYWSLTSLVGAIRQSRPDFQRPAGDYDTWYLRDLQSGEPVRGFENWERVDGALIRSILTGPLHWLGILDLASPSNESAPTAFRYTLWAPSLLQGTPPEGLPLEEAKIIVRSDARLWVPRLAPRSVRYQLARFCIWDGQKDDGYSYQITPVSLEHARSKGLRVGQLLGLLRRYAATVPPVLSRSLERWEERGTEARLQAVMVLRVGSPDLLQALRASRAARFLGDPLGPTAIIVKPGAWLKVVAVLAELGYLSEIKLEESEN